MKSNVCIAGTWSAIVCVGALLLFSTASYATVRPSTANAALLYYQAFLVKPGADETPTQALLAEVLGGAAPSPAIRTYLDASQESIQLAMAATRFSKAAWGLGCVPWGTISTEVRNITSELRQLAILLNIGGRAAVLDGEWHMAAERCLGVRRLADHIEDEIPIWYTLSMQFHTGAFECIEYLLEHLPPSEDVLVWLQGQLALQGPPPLPTEVMDIALECALESQHQNQMAVETWRANVLERMDGPTEKDRLLSLGHQDLLQQARESYVKFMVSAARVIGSELPYEQKYLQLRQLQDGLSSQAAAGDPVGLILFFLPDVSELYDLYILRAAHFNAIKAAIEVYIAWSVAGHLPETLPTGLPRDPYSNLEFSYIRTDNGFILRSQARDITLDVVHEYVFDVSAKANERP